MSPVQAGSHQNLTTTSTIPGSPSLLQVTTPY